MKRQGFIKRAYEFAFENLEFLLHYLSIEKFEEDNKYFTNFRVMCDLVNQIYELVWNITVQSADIVYTDALEFYASAREASKRRVDAAETIYKDLETFFKRKKHPVRMKNQPKKLKRDINALIHGKHDGKIEIENINPRLSAGKHKVIDGKFNDTARFKESEEGEIEE
jgi:flagellar basal body-associated protein FliL